MKKKKIDFRELPTEFEKQLNPADPWNYYPRPHLKRDSFLSLNGFWDINGTNKKGELISGRINVPFPPQSRLSQTYGAFDDVDELNYFRQFEIESAFLKDRVVIHFGAIDQYARVYINGKFVGENEGGYLPFKFDVTDYINIGVNSIKVVAVDYLSVDYPYGKQSKKRGGMWYTPVSGIWQTVWLESVCENYIEDLEIVADLNSVTVNVFGGENRKEILLNENIYKFEGDSITINIENPVCWTPENPHLYDFVLKSGNDTVNSYFALRTVSVEYGKCAYIALNGKPYYFNGVLDQGYYSDGIYLPATVEGYLFDILTMKKLGFNMLRKHAKIEPDIFYYLCDKYGMIVFQDFVNSGKYNFVFDTALPTAFLKWGVFHIASEKRRKIFEKSAVDTVRFLRNHPSVCYYTIFNEGWGQYNASRLYSKMKKLDNTRVWDTASGWFKTLKSDVKSEHVYFKPVKLRGNKKKPLVLSEFGGYSYKVSENSFNQSKNYGYKFYDDVVEFEKGIVNLYLNEILSCVKKGLCASVLTQVSDVEDETNGLVTYDRKIVKIDEKTMKQIYEKLQEAFIDLMT